MKKWIISIIILMLTIIFYSGLQTSTVKASGNTIYVGGNGPGNYSTIQSAINGANTGDTIFVYSGTYYEDVIVNKTIDLIGENRESTIIKGSTSSDVINISADFVNIGGFTIQNGNYGIYLYNSYNTHITGNNVNSNNYCGICLWSSSGNTITGNNVSNNLDGILLLLPSSNNNIVYNNFISNINNFFDEGNNIWNIDKTLGTNIMGGSYLGGNFWNNYTGTDTDGDGLGDTNVPYGPGDYLPLVYSSNQHPTAYIDSITPMLAEEGETVSFVGHGVDIDGTIITYNWESSIDGLLSSSASFDASWLSIGTHVISFKVQDNDLLWSSMVPRTLIIFLRDNQPPSKVTGLTVKDATDGKLDLSWNPSTDDDIYLYKIYRDGGFLTNVTHPTTSYRNTGLTNGQIYTYEVSALDYSGNEGQKSDPISGTSTKTTSDGEGDGGDGSSGGPTNSIPIANASNGEPYQGYIEKNITFDGSLSYDPDGDNLTYSWNFGDGSTDGGEITSHLYLEPGTYTVFLTVKDESGANDTDQTMVFILLQQNNSLSKPIISGKKIGTTNSEYSYNILSINQDNDTIKYYIIWGDETESITESEFLPNGTAFIAEHMWNTVGKFTMSVIASNNKTTSETSTFTVYIDTMDVGELGYFIDKDSDGTYDRFHNETSQIETNVSMKNTEYLIDDNGDGKWDYTFTNTGELKSYNEQKEETPGFEIILLLVGLIFVFYWKRKNNNLQKK